MNVENPRHCMIDLETLGTTPGSVITEIGLVVFHYGDIIEEWETHIELKSCLDAGLFMEQGTLNWRFQKNLPFRLADSSKKPIPLSDMMWQMAQRITIEDFIWCHGLSFDLPMLSVASKLTGIPLPWNFRKERDCRTYPGYSKNNVERRSAEHLALSDARHQTICLIEAFKKFPFDGKWEV